VNLDNISSPGEGVSSSCLGRVGVPKCAKRKLCPALPVGTFVVNPLVEAVIVAARGPPWRLCSPSS
jgi:hypothetical protein